MFCDIFIVILSEIKEFLRYFKECIVVDQAVDNIVYQYNNIDRTCNYYGKIFGT